MYKRNRVLITVLFYCLIFSLLGYGLGREVGYDECLENVICINK